MEAPRASLVTPASAAAALSGAWLACTAAPSVAYRDAGELTTAAFHLDVAHPTGFPLDLALMRLAALAPVGDVALRVNALVACLGALACALVASLASRAAEGLGPVARWLCALAPVVAALCSGTLERAWTAAEVYASSAALALAAVCVARASELPTAPRRRLVAVMAGACVTSVHTTARPAVALSLAALALVDARALDARGWLRRAAAVAACALSTATLVAWIPVASRRDGPVDWNDPESLRGVLEHVTARSIRESYAGRMLVAWRVPEDLAAAARVLWADLGPVALCLAAVGAAGAARDGTARMLLALAAVDVLYAAALNPMGLVDRQTLHHAELFALALAALGVATTWGAGSTRWRRALAPAAAAVMACVALARRDPAWAGAADGWSMHEVLLGAGALGAVPPRAVVLCTSDDLCGGSLYAQHVEGERPDVTVLQRYALHRRDVWRRLRGAPTAPGRDGDPAADVPRTRALMAWAGDRLRVESSREDRPVRLRLGSGETPVLAAWGAPPGEVDRGAEAWVRARTPASRGMGARYVAAVAVFGAASRVARDDLAAAEGMWRATVSLDPRHVSARTNLGAAAARRGDLRAAVTLTREALALDPERPVAWDNLAAYLRALGDADGAAAAAREAARRR